jgi:hypothetical protein
MNQGTSAGGDAAALALGGASPDSVVDAVRKRVFQARPPYNALGTVAAGDLDPDPVARKEHLCG